MKKYCRHFENGFTLVELLVVIAILGILATIGLTSFTSAQVRGRDTQRKNDLKQISTSLELYFADHGTYPDSSSGQILGCPSVTSTPCVWGASGSSSQFTDNKTIYFRTLPEDPSSGYNYYYRPVTVNSIARQGFQLFARLENSRDINCIDKNCGSHPELPAGVTCGGTNVTCNFAITSPNTTPTE